MTLYAMIVLRRCHIMKRSNLQKINYINGGIQFLYFFENGYGASLVQHKFSYGTTDGLWEIAVLTGKSDDFSLCYSTKITSDVVGHLTDEDTLKV